MVYVNMSTESTLMNECCSLDIKTLIETRQYYLNKNNYEDTSNLWK